MDKQTQTPQPQQSGAVPLDILILAAGLGTRMRSGTAKVLHRLGGRPLIAHVCRAAAALLKEARPIYVVVNDRPVSAEQAAAYAAEGAQQIGLTDHLLEKEYGGETEIVRADLLDEGEKVRHSPQKLARVIAACYEQAATLQHRGAPATTPAAVLS